LNLDPTAQTQEFIVNVEGQLLESDLRDSMLEGTGLPLNIATLNGVKLRCGPVLCEVTDITEIGHSAFTLLNTRQQRNELEDLANLALDDGVENDEGPCPDYPRTMLRLELTDGTTTVHAVECRKIPQLKLGETPLGYKVCLRPSLTFPLIYSHNR
jgi:RecQ-mediated genome instability protein 1